MSKDFSLIQEECQNKYIENLEFFRIFHNKIYNKVINFNEDEKYSLVIHNNMFNIEYKNSKKLFIKNEISNIPMNSIVIGSDISLPQKVIFISDCLGYNLEKYCTKTELKSILIIDDNLELFRLSLFTINYKKTSYNRKLLFCIEEPKEVIESYIKLFYNSLFFYNNTITINNTLSNKYFMLTKSIIEELDAVKITNNEKDISSVIDTIKSKITNNSFNSLFNDILTRIEKIEHNKEVSNTFSIPMILGLIDFIEDKNIPDNDYNFITNNLYYCLLFVDLSLNGVENYISKYCVNYFLVTEQINGITNIMYKRIIFILKSKLLFETAAKFQEIYINYTVNNFPEDRELIEHEKYILKSLAGEKLDISNKSYVEYEFDNFAKSFENKLLNELQYKIPEILKEEIYKYIDINHSYNILDLGCGTGLIGNQLQTITNSIIGIDLSKEMLNQAKNKNIYSKLLNIDIIKYLKQEKESTFEIVVAADVFVYIGDLKEIFQYTSYVLKKDGIFAFSIEFLYGINNYKLNETGRFSHTIEYINKLCKKYKFNNLCTKKTIGRIENGVNVESCVFVLSKK